MNGYGVDGLAEIVYENGGQILKAIPEKDSNGFYTMILPDGKMKIMASNVGFHRKDVEEDPLYIRSNGCIISKARANFQTNKIKTATSLSLDSSKFEEDEKADFTSLKQLLVDISAIDNEKFVEINRTAGTDVITWDEFEPMSNMHRFRNAFNTFFEHLQLQGVRTSDGFKDVFFTKHGYPISIDSLSTGEKQIVYRGGMLLRNYGLLDKGTVLIDEPELSMHPRWQEKTLLFYQNLFLGPNGEQMSQLFFATHSEHILKSALEDPNKNLVIMLHDNNGTIECKRITAPFVLKTISFSEINYEAFGMISTDYHIALYSRIQNQGAKVLNLKETDDLIRNHSSYDPTIHYRPSSGLGSTTYETLPTYIRNGIDHPESGNTFTEEDLRISIDLLRKI